MVNLMEFRSVNIGSRLFPGAVVHRSVMVIDIMVSRYHQDLYACVLDPFKPCRQLLMVQPLPVHSNIAAENQGRGPFLYDLVQKCFQKLRQILDHLSVTPLHKQPESFPAVSS